MSEFRVTAAQVQKWHNSMPTKSGRPRPLPFTITYALQAERINLYAEYDGNRGKLAALLGDKLAALWSTVYDYRTFLPLELRQTGWDKIRRTTKAEREARTRVSPKQAAPHPTPTGASDADAIVAAFLRRLATAEAEIARLTGEVERLTTDLDTATAPSAPNGAAAAMSAMVTR